jgi:ethanolamine utilization protein EutP (predicted NTPase)
MSKTQTLKSKLIYSSERLLNIANELPKELSAIKSTDSSGRDEQDLFEIVKSLSSKFDQLSEELDSPFKIAVVGSQGTGKSTVVNLLLGEALMPSTTLENESAVIRLAYPIDNFHDGQAVFELFDGNTTTTTIEEANRLIDKNKRSNAEYEFVKKIKYVTFYKESEQLKKIELVNTPGMNVLTDDFYPKIKHLFTEADIIIWVNSGEQILDDFNSWLIKKIHADNDKIVGLITFPDKLYKQDENTGVTDVVSQFMEKLEDGKLIRVENKIGLFIFNGNFAQISESHKTNLKFINDVDDLEEDEEKLKMLYNFFHHGFAYSDDPKNIEILKKYNLYGLEDFSDFVQLDDQFNLESFYNYCLDNDYCHLNDDSTTALYTEKGLKLLGEASQYYSFGRFSEEYLLPMSLQSKYESVKSRLDRMLSKSESKDNSISRLIQIKEKLELKKEELGENEQVKIEEFNNIIKSLKTEYKHWHTNQIDFQTNKYSDELIDIIVGKIEKDINGADFMKEIVNSLTPRFLKSDKETAISMKFSKIISEAIEKILPKNIEDIANDANNQIEYILIKMQQDFLSQKNTLNTKNNHVNINFSSNINTSQILSKISVLLKPLLKKVMIELAKKDLRKGGNTFIKKNIIKPIVILIRKLLTKMGVNFAKKKAASAATKGAMGPFGWLLLIGDVVMSANDFHNMYKEMKKTLGDQMKEEPSFREGFIEEAERVYNSIIDIVIIDITASFAEEREDISFIIKGINASENILIELDKHTKKEDIA